MPRTDFAHSPQKARVWTFAGSYAIDMLQNATQPLFGGRMPSLEQTLNRSFNGHIGAPGLPGRSGSTRGDETNRDAIVGLQGAATRGADRRWVLRVLPVSLRDLI